MKKPCIPARLFSQEEMDLKMIDDVHLTVLLKHPQ